MDKVLFTGAGGLWIRLKQPGGTDTAQAYILS